MSNGLKKLYSTPLPAKRTGALYNAVPYPTKISPEAIAIYIACHTEEGDTVFDPFAGSGTTGIATLLCDNPTDEMIRTAQELGVNPKWGKRKAVLYELSTLGSFISNVMCNPPSSKGFEEVANSLLKNISNELSEIYIVEDDRGQKGTIRHIIWSDIIICPNCKNEYTYFDVAVQKSPLHVKSHFVCPACRYENRISSIDRATEEFFDPILKKPILRKKRIPAWIYGRTDKRNWNRKATQNDNLNISVFSDLLEQSNVPLYKIRWGVLYRKGYHKGITHLHHFYTERNLIVFSRLWAEIDTYPKQYQDALKLLLLSYNSSHSTLMSRVVVKKKSSDFVITGSQSGVLYISSLPVEKNIFEGLRRKISTLSKAFQLTENSGSDVSVFNRSSTNIVGWNNSIDYIFTDPPFGDYIPYSEINQINEAWLDNITENRYEVVINKAQKKNVFDYEELMGQVFQQLNKVLKNDGKISLVFHSAKSEVWRSLANSFSKAGFNVSLSNILDKIQGSFKQVTSSNKVQGDPLLLLTKKTKLFNQDIINHQKGEDQIINQIIFEAFNSRDLNELKPERLYSRYISMCLETGVTVSRNAKDFYLMLRKINQSKHNVVIS